jgi:murein DD-endopeptidase MepM/ murein hydrolase activator NlpD
MVKYADYLKATLPGRAADLEARKAQFQQVLSQLQNNASAPTVSGSYGVNPSTASLDQLNGNFKAVGNKTLPIDGRVSQNWGASRIKYAAGRHTGMDFAAPIGTPVRSVANGVVARVGRQGAYGNTIHVRHPDGATSVYAHLNGANVRAGQKVKSGQTIGKSGNTGRSTGPHLHFEIRTRDRYGSDVNPRSWLGR